ncbi:hypothetical protein PR048_033432 [Dryococelus australis]|uniref:Protein zwilch n=1 Tax=Dryococelus australis TaxID=614101 RepID=A0ABQ9G094_9NEOP|nr:hypothetical protein PR048_033432 [Dryococelus australis]
MPGIMTANCKTFFEILCDGKCSEFSFTEAPTYINPFFGGAGDGKEDIILVYGVDTSVKNGSTSTDLQSPESMLEYTGNPLECPFSDDDYEPTATSVFNCWKKEEEIHFPLSLQEARDILSAFNLRHCDEESGGTLWPVWVVCRDPASQTVLVGTHMDDGWCTSSRVRCLECMSRQQVSERLAAVQLQHLSITGTSQQELLSEVMCLYNIHGDSSLSKQRVTMQVKWANAVTLNVPVYDAEASVALQVTVGEEDSIMHDLWLQLNALSHYVEQMKVPQGSDDVVVAKPCDVDNAFKKRIAGVLYEANYKLSARFISSRYKTVDGTERVIDLEHTVSAVAEGCRTNRDLMDMLWQLLSECTDSEELVKRISAVLKAIRLEGCKFNVNAPKLQAHRLGQIIAKLFEEGSECPNVQHCEVYQMMAEVGLEKLMRDYWYILLEGELMTADQLQYSANLQARSGPGPEEAAHSKLALLGQLHCVTELLLLAKRHISDALPVLRLFGAEACRSVLPADTTFQELVKRREAELTCGITTPHIQGHLSR